MLYCDHFYTMGKTHSVCEDYALKGNKPIPFVVVCDGCSASEHSDLGAKVLSLTTKHILENTPEWPLSYNEFGQRLITRSLWVINEMQLRNCALDSTVMLAFLHENTIRVYIYGDGCLLFQDNNDNIGFIDISFTHNAPFYLTYWPDKERQEEYGNYAPKPLLITDSVNGTSGPMSYQTPLSFSFSLDKFHTIAIASDGATQVINIDNGQKLPLFDVTQKLLAFDNCQGSFVNAHMEQLLDSYEQKGIFPADDLSLGVFINKPN